MTKMVAVEGNTYPIKEQIKALGGKWDGVNKHWMVPEEKAAEVFRLLQNVPAPAPRSNTTYRRRTAPGVSNYGSGRGGKCRAPGCSAMATRAGYCRQCYFDEFDN